jgi:ABC-type multidrug transport system ATPase subunit
VAELAADAIVILSSHIVSDIDTISDQVAIMKNGQMMMFGKQHELIKTTAGKVFETHIDREYLPVFKEKNIVINVTHQSEKLKVRYISDNPMDNSIPQEANLEDAYLYITKR